MLLMLELAISLFLFGRLGQLSGATRTAAAAIIKPPRIDKKTQRASQLIDK